MENNIKSIEKLRREREETLALLFKKEIRDMMRSRYKDDMLVRWRDDFVVKLKSPLQSLRERISRDRAQRKEKIEVVVPAEGDRKDSDNQKTKIKVITAEDEYKEGVMGALKCCWYGIRRELSMQGQTLCAYYLGFLALHKDLMGLDAYKLNLQYLEHRRPVFDVEKVISLGVDAAIRMRNYIVYERYTDLEKRGANRMTARGKNDGQPAGDITKEMNLENAATTAIMLLWEGIPFNDIRKLGKPSFYYSEKHNVLFIRNGRSYRLMPLALETWIAIERRLKRIWSEMERQGPKENITFEKAFPGFQNRVISILKDAAAKTNVPIECVSMESFRQIGIFNSLITLDASPAHIASTLGPEITLNVHAPCRFFEGYIPPKLKIRGGEEQGDFFGLIDGDIKGLRECGDIVSEYNETNNRQAALKKIDELMAVCKSNAIGYARYLITLKTNKGKYLSPNAVRTYYFRLKDLFVRNRLNGGISEEDLVDLLIEEDYETSRTSQFIDYVGYKNYRSALTHFQVYLTSKGLKVPKINWNRFIRNSERTCRLIVIPDESKIRGKIDWLWGQDDRLLKYLSVVVIMAYWLGLRISEILDAECCRVVFLGKDSSGENEDYIEIFGKGSKYRRVPLCLIPAEYLANFMEVLSEARKDGRTVFFEKQDHGKIKYRFEKYFKNTGIAPSGMHSLRHAFATRHIIKGMDIVKLASLMGHESLRVIHNTYDQSAYEVLRGKASKCAGNRKMISLKQLRSLLQVTGVGFTKLMSKKALFPQPRSVGARKKGESYKQFVYKDIVNMICRDLIKRSLTVDIKDREGFLWEKYFVKKCRGRAKRMNVS